MKVIHVLRKPTSEGTVAANVLRYGTGALNIDASRVAFTSEADEQESKAKNQHADFGTPPLTGNTVYGDYSMVPMKNYNAPGRWPANLVLQHLGGCRQEGTFRVKSSDRPRHGHEHSPVSIFGPNRRHSEIRHGSEDGMETVAAWSCELGCPVAALDAQSGTLAPQGGQKKKDTKAASFLGTAHGGATDSTFYGDTGGASRFFKQISGKGQEDSSDG